MFAIQLVVSVVMLAETRVIHRYRKWDMEVTSLV